MNTVMLAAGAEAGAEEFRPRCVREWKQGRTETRQHGIRSPSNEDSPGSYFALRDDYS
jgi:hypothetical protein